MQSGNADLRTAPPKYEVIKHSLLNRIRVGEWQIGSQIPSENELAREYGVSRVTIRRTLRDLVDAGVIVRMTGAGTFVARHRMRSAFVRLDDLTEYEAASKGQRELLVSRLHTLNTMGCDDVRLPQALRGLYLMVRWEKQNTVVSIERWLIGLSGALDVYATARSGSSIADSLYEHHSIDAIDEISRIASPPRPIRGVLQIADRSPRISVTRRFYSQARWVASVRETYASATLSVRRRYSTLCALSSGDGGSADDPERFGQAVSRPADDRWLY